MITGNCVTAPGLLIDLSYVSEINFRHTFVPFRPKQEQNKTFFFFRKILLQFLVYIIKSDQRRDISFKAQNNTNFYII